MHDSSRVFFQCEAAYAVTHAQLIKLPYFATLDEKKISLKQVVC